MSQNILITGAAGYIGGSVLAEMISREMKSCSKDNLFAAVRSTEQKQTLDKLGVHTVVLNLDDNTAVEEAILANQINIIIHTAGSFRPDMATSLINALAKRGQKSGEETHFVNSSVSAMFTPEGGWPHGQVSDFDPDMLAKEKSIEAEQASNPVRETNIVVADLSEKVGVKSYNVIVPTVYGRGAGEIRKLSVKIPALLREIISSRTVHKYKSDAHEVSAHISDLVALYTLIIDHILRGESIPSGRLGYYFPFAHTIHWWAVMDRLAELLLERGLIDSGKVLTWSNDEEAAARLGFPVKHIGTMLANTGELAAEKSYSIGWRPLWNEQKFMDDLDSEIKDVLEVDTVKPTLFQTVMS